MTTAFSKVPPKPLTPAELEQRFAESYPEARGPGMDTESGAVDYGQLPDPRVGAIPKLLDDATRDRDNAARAAALAALTPAERAAQENMRRMIREEMRNV